MMHNVAVLLQYGYLDIFAPYTNLHSLEVGKYVYYTLLG